jgi:hypothetical protein
MTTELESAAQPPRRRSQWRADSAWRVISLTPFGLALVLVIFANSYLPGIMSKPPDILGLPLGAVVDALTLLWAALGAYVIWTTRSLAVASIALLASTGPAVVVLIFAPAAIRIMVNL